MGKTELIQKMLEILPNMPDGAEVSVGDLLKCAGIKGEYSQPFEIYREVKDWAKVKGIQMLPCACEYSESGLVSDITFIKETVA